jgi:Tfp pilus assembly protein PilX
MKMNSLRKQGGATLIIGLFMLILMTVMAIATYNMGKGNLQAVGNMQFRTETQRVAERTLETVISTADAVTTTVVYPETSDGYKVKVEPSLVQGFVKKNNTLDLSNPGEVGCSLGAAQTFGIVGSSTGNSLCALTLYNVKVTAEDTRTKAKVVLDQGVAIQVPADTICSKVAC